MNKQDEHLENLSEIRSLMERSSRFISLSGLSGVAAGIFAIVGAVAAYYYLGKYEHTAAGEQAYYEYAKTTTGEVNTDFYTFFFTDAIVILLVSVVTVCMLTFRSAKKRGQSVWDATAKRLLINMLIPLITGGLFCLVLLYHELTALIAPAMLIFYGLALLNASKYTLDDIRYLGICEIGLGLIASLYVDYGLIFWAVGFGLLHIIYGMVMYNKYEK